MVFGLFRRRGRGPISQCIERESDNSRTAGLSQTRPSLALATTTAGVVLSSRARAFLEPRSQKIGTMRHARRTLPAIEGPTREADGPQTCPMIRLTRARSAACAGRSRFASAFSRRPVGKAARVWCIWPLFCCAVPGTATAGFYYLLDHRRAPAMGP